LINRIIHIVDNLLPVNFGIWNAAISPSEVLEKTYGIKSECWFPFDSRNGNLPNSIKGVELKSLTFSELKKRIDSESPDPSTTLIMTHGAWQYPTRWGSRLSKMGFQWWYVPHGMLEPWSMNQKRLKKWLYFNLIEKKLTENAKLIRAVGKPEQKNLERLFSRDITLIPNGIEAKSLKLEKSFSFPRKFLFMSRLHSKKGIIPLVNAWYSSTLSGSPNFELIIAGPDDGELNNLQQVMSLHPEENVIYKGAEYGEEKKKLLASAHFFLLPSQSEGFPTSIPEAMQYGIIPIFSEGCNFPEAFEAEMAIKTSTDVESIKISLEHSSKLDEQLLSDWSKRISTFVKEKYSLPVIAKRIAEELNQ